MRNVIPNTSLPSLPQFFSNLELAKSLQLTKETARGLAIGFVKPLLTLAVAGEITATISAIAAPFFKSQECYTPPQECTTIPAGWFSRAQQICTQPADICNDIEPSLTVVAPVVVLALATTYIAAKVLVSCYSKCTAKESPTKHTLAKDHQKNTSPSTLPSAGEDSDADEGIVQAAPKEDADKPRPRIPNFLDLNYKFAWDRDLESDSDHEDLEPKDSDAKKLPTTPRGSEILPRIAHNFNRSWTLKIEEADKPKPILDHSKVKPKDPLENARGE